MAELADARDLKSLGGNTVPVRSRLAAPSKNPVTFRLRGFILSKKPFLSIFWVLRTLRYQWRSRVQLRKYGM